MYMMIMLPKKKYLKKKIVYVSIEAENFVRIDDGSRIHWEVILILAKPNLE